ncbi:MAG TPA: hypothetical protein VKQ71_16825 [Acidimicrobiales bacterium]|nr:hypothetical protein [Acidimicrobiales bacterium]
MTPTKRIDRQDIEDKLREIRGEVTATTDRAKPAIVTVAVAAGVFVVAVFYLLGRRVGKKKTTVVEIRRV